MNPKKNKALQLVTAALVMMLTAGGAMAQATVDPEVSSGIADAIATILLIIGLGGAGYIVISSASTGWNVGAKFIKRLGGKA